MANYPIMQNGELVSPKMEGYKMRCCDCNLVHKIDFAIVKIKKEYPDGSMDVETVEDKFYKVVFRVHRDERATAACRRKKSKEGLRK